jgi:hypothetical protein
MEPIEGKGCAALPLVFNKVYEYSTFCQKMGFMVRTGLPGHPSWLWLALLAWKFYSFEKRFPGIKWDLITSLVWTWHLLAQPESLSWALELTQYTVDQILVHSSTQISAHLLHWTRNWLMSTRCNKSLAPWLCLSHRSVHSHEVPPSSSSQDSI